MIEGKHLQADAEVLQLVPLNGVALVRPNSRDPITAKRCEIRDADQMVTPGFVSGRDLMLR